jgi:hypothetical protein
VLLLQHLPQALANDLRLRRVSRERHIEIFLDGTAWFLIAYATTFLDGQRLLLQQSIALPKTGCALLLGSEGWPIEVVLT